MLVCVCACVCVFHHVFHHQFNVMTSSLRTALPMSLSCSYSELWWDGSYSQPVGGKSIYQLSESVQSISSSLSWLLSLYFILDFVFVIFVSFVFLVSNVESTEIQLPDSNWKNKIQTFQILFIYLSFFLFFLFKFTSRLRSTISEPSDLVGRCFY